jgi:probable HAF family extracellular repeat protein
LLSGGQYTTLDDPNAVNGTFALGINASGQIVGEYVDASSALHGFLLSGGQYTTLDDPNAVNGTFALGINASGQIVGGYFDASFAQHGFLLSGGQYMTIDDPNGIQTFASGITASGTIVDAYLAADLTVHADVIRHGQYTTLDDPNAGTGLFQGTYGRGINDSGKVVGDYLDSSYGDHAYLATPTHGGFPIASPGAVAGPGSLRNLTREFVATRPAGNVVFTQNQVPNALGDSPASSAPSGTGGLSPKATLGRVLRGRPRSWRPPRPVQTTSRQAFPPATPCIRKLWISCLPRTAWAEIPTPRPGCCEPGSVGLASLCRFAIDITNGPEKRP